MFKIYPFISLLVLIFVSSNLSAQNWPVITIDSDRGFHAPEEPSILVNPNNPDNIIAAANIKSLYHSHDGGKTWTKKKMTSTHGVFGDPCLVIDTTGRIYYFHLSDPTGQGWASEEILDRIVCQTSDDGGVTWSAGSYMGLNGARDQDKEWACVDPSTNTVYVTWTQFDKYGSRAASDSTLILFSSSKDRGKTWSPAVRLNQLAGDCIDEDNTVEGAVPAVGPNGEVYVAWALGDHIWFDRSTDGGKTWLAQDIKAVKNTAGWDIPVPGIMRANGLPITKCDLSEGPHRGTIYINWTDQRNGTDDSDVWIAKSTNGGHTWSKPIRVNDDTGKAHQFFTWMDIDPTTGYLYCVFYDRRGLEGNATDVYLAVSKDGGQTFENEKISKESFTPSEKVFFGDYNNISAYGGVIRPVWTHMSESRELSIRTALINLK